MKGRTADEGSRMKPLDHSILCLPQSLSYPSKSPAHWPSTSNPQHILIIFIYYLIVAVVAQPSPALYETLLVFRIHGWLRFCPPPGASGWLDM